MHKIKRSADAINILMYAMVISTAGLFLLDTFTNADQRIWLLLLGNTLVMSAIYAMRVFVKKMPVFFGLHILLIAACIALAAAGGTYVAICAGLFCALAVFATLLDMLFWANAVKEEKNMPVAEDGSKLENFRPIYQEGLPYIPLAFVIAFLPGIAYSVYAARPYHGQICYIFGVLFIGLSFLRMYLSRMGKTVDDITRERGDVPSRLLISNAKLTVPVLILLFVAMFVLQSAFLVEVFDQIVLALLKAGVWLIGMFLRFLSFLGRSVGGSTSVPAQPVLPEGGTGGGFFAKLVEQLLTVVFFGTLLVLVIRGVIRFIRYFSFRSVNRKHIVSKEEMTEVRERLQTKERHRRERAVGHASADGKIRRIYKRFIRRQQKNGLAISPYETPLERIDLLERVSGRERGEICSLTDIYDVARYAPMRITEEDVKTMERLV